MMLCDDISNNLPAAHGQSKRPMDGLQFGLKTGETLESATAEQMTIALKSNDCPKSIPTLSDQGNWQTNHSEQRTRLAEFTTGNQRNNKDMQNIDTKIMDTVMLSSEMLPEGRCSKRMADYTNMQHPSYGITKKIKLDVHSANNDSIQEHWKKGAMGYQSREIPLSTSDCVTREVAKCSKEDLSHRVNRLDGTILHNEMALAKLRSTLENLEESVTKSSNDSGELEKEVGSRMEELKPQLSCFEQVLFENRRKAEASHAFLNKTKSLTGSFLYQQPCDTVIYHENKQKFMTFEKRLVTYLKKREKLEQLRSEKLNQELDRLREAWKNQMEVFENGQKQGSKNLHEYFDKIFPDMQKQEEEKIQRYCSSGPKLYQTSEQSCSMDEAGDKLDIEIEVMEKLKSLAAIPPPLLDSRSRRLRFLNENGIIVNPKQINSTSTLKCSFWTDHEREIFTEKYVRNPKKFGLIASLLENKSVQDCVQFYYLTKKEVGYKKLQRTKYTRKLKIRGTINNTKEEKAESKNFSVETESTREQYLPYDNGTNSLCEQKNASSTEQSEEAAPQFSKEVVKRSSFEPVLNRRLSSLEHPISHLSSNSSESSLAGTDQSSKIEKNEVQKIRAIDSSAKVTEQEIQANDSDPAAPEAQKVVAKCHESPSQPTEEEERTEQMRDSGKAAEDDTESVATLSADEAGGHCPDDDCPPDKAPSKPLQTSEKRQNAFGVKMDSTASELFRAEVSSGRVQRSQTFLPMSVDSEESRRPFSDQDEGRRHLAMPAMNPLLALNPRNEFHGMIRPSETVVNERSKAMPELRPSTRNIQGCNQQAYSPSLGVRCSDGRVTGLSSFSRNTGSPTRIRDLIHAAIEKNLQAIDSKSDLVSLSRNDSKQFRPLSGLNFKPTSASSLGVENAEVQDLSMRTCRVLSASKTTTPVAGKLTPSQTTLYQLSKAESPFHPRPAHTHHPDTRAGSLLDLANAAEYEHLRRLEKEQQQKAAAERDSFLLRFETSLPCESYNLNPAVSSWRQREEPVHKGSIMQGTPISTSQHYRNQPARPAADSRIEGLGIVPSSAGHNTMVQPESISWQRPFYPQVVPQISSEHNKLLCNDFLTAQQLRSMQEAYNPYQDVPLRASLASQHDPATELYQPSRTASSVRNFPNTDPYYPQQYLSVGRSDRSEFLNEAARGGQKSFSESRFGGGCKVIPAFRHGPSEAERDRFPAALLTDRNPIATVKPVSAASCKPDLLNCQSAAQLIEQIINSQITKPDGDDKIEAPSILSRIDEINCAKYDGSEFAHLPITLGSNRARKDLVIPRTSSKLASEERTTEFGGRTSEKSFVSNVGTHDRGFISDVQVHRRDIGLPVSERGCVSGTGGLDKPLTLSSGMVQSDMTLPYNVANVNPENAGSYKWQIKKPSTFGESLDSVIEDVTRRSNLQNPIDSNHRFAMRNFLSGSDSIQLVGSRPREGVCPETGLSQSHSSSPVAIAMARATGINTDVVKSKEDSGVTSKDGSLSRGFSWKTKLLREHQKQQIESEDPNQTATGMPIDTESKMNDRQPCQLSSSELSHLNYKEGGSLGQSDAASNPISRLSSPSDGHASFGPSGAYTVGEDQQSTIAATHQMMSTLLSNRSGRPTAQIVPPSSSAVCPVQPDPQPLNLKPKPSEDSALNEITASEQCEKQTVSPVATGPESPNSDSRGSDPPGRLVIRMDSSEDIQSP